MTNTAKNKQNKASNNTVIEKVKAFTTGALVATAAVGYFLYGPKGSENRKKVEAWTVRAKGEVLSKLEAAKDVSEETYHTIVDTVTARYAKAKNVGEEKADKLNRELKSHWTKIRREIKTTSASAGKKVNTLRKTIAQKISPPGA
jgi:hypothetical protein